MKCNISCLTNVTQIETILFKNLFFYHFEPLNFKILMIYLKTCNDSGTELLNFVSICTVWKFQDFSVIQILREIYFETFTSSENAIFALNFVTLLNFSLQKVNIYQIQNSKFKSSKYVKMADFALLETQNLISRKI